MKFSSKILGSIIASTLISSNCAFSTSSLRTTRSSIAAAQSRTNGNDENTRRELLTSVFAACAASVFTPKRASADPENLNAFNTLTFNYRGSDFEGLDGSTLNEPSIKYSEFLDKLTAGEVVFVEFMAPDGDVAYATLKSQDGEGSDQRIRIGQGYPIEQHDGWSSPAFAVRSVKEKGVPYKFTVPGLEKYK